MSEFGIQPGEQSANGRRARLRRLVAVLGWTAVGVYFAAAAVVLGLRYWLLPNIAQYSGFIEQAVSRTIGERVTIGAIRAGWQGLRPELDLTDFKIYDRDGRVALSLPAVETTVSWTSFAFGTLRFHSLAFEQPDLEIRRDAEGRIYVAGMQLRDDRAGPDISIWLLSQREIVVRNASVSWDDEQRAAPRLELSGVTFILRNRGALHRFGLRAQVRAELASALDLRGELRGASVGQLQDWTGRLFAELDYTDLAAWQRWIDYPLEINSGKGGIRLWLGFTGGRLTEAVADVALAGVSTRLSRDLPLLGLDYLEGRLGAKRLGNGYEVLGKKLSLKSGGEVALAPADFDVRWEPASADRPQHGELQANALELEPLARLGEFLPLPRELRQRFADLAPRGGVFDLKLAWDGEVDRPKHYSVRGRFSNLGARAVEHIPAFSGLTGNIEANENGGNLSLVSAKAAVDLPGILPGGGASLDTLSGQIVWVAGRNGLELKFSNVALANRNFAGVLFGSFATRPEGPGFIDLTGNFSRVEGKIVQDYIPRLPAQVVDYLRSSVLSGQGRDVRLRLKGDLRDFPFEDPKKGSFQVVGKVSGVNFDYAKGWPRLEGVNAELVFEGRQMRIFASKGAVLGARIANVKATIPDLFHDNEVLTVEGQADGPTSEFLRFVAASPVTGFIDGFTEDMRATGNGRLQLRLELPIRRLGQSRVTGNFQIAGNQVVIDPAVPPLTQVGGRIDFTESGISARNLSCQFLGGAAVISAATQADGTVVVTTQGTATVAGARRLPDLPFRDQMSGSTSWRGSLSIKGRAFDLAVESNLQGVALDLPPPLGKTAAEPMAFRLERTNNAQSEALRRFQVQRIPARGDAVMLTIGPAVNGVIVRAREGERLVVSRAALGLNERAPAPDRPGIVAAGSLPYLDLDRWRALFGGEDVASTLPAALNVRIGALDVEGKRLNELTMRATRSAAVWTASVSAKELAGDVTWRPEGQGRVIARLRHFTVPESTPGAILEARPTRELPALDVIADDFVVGDKKLGRLELMAVNQARDWRIEKLVLSTAESTLSADGYWQSWAARPSTSFNVKLDVGDAGKYLDRMGYPGTMRGGHARLEGKLAWAGSPQEIDYPTLMGNVTLKVEKGQFLRADPGVAKLLGILSLQSLLTFDLRDLFREGFVFDSIASNASITKGVLTTKDFDMRGAAARVGMTGDIDLTHETQNLRLRVVPALGDSAATAATLLLKINPVTGLGALIAQRILKDPLGQLFSLQYTVTGTWSDPKVVRISAEAEEPAAQ